MNDSNGSSPLVQPRTAIVDIYVGDDLDQLRHLERLAQAAKDAAGGMPRLNSEVPEYLELAQQHDELAKAAEARALHVKVQALGRKAWKTLCAEHPPRKAGGTVTEEQAKADAEVGVNEETFKDALVAASIVEPALTQDDLDQLADIDFDRIYLTAFRLNRTPAAAGPKASLVSRLTPKSEETSS